MKVLVLLSGGIDSAVVLNLALMEGHGCCAVGFDYGQPHKIELERADEIAAHSAVSFEIVKIPSMPKVNDIVFAGRNAVLISMGAAIAQAKGLDAIAIGSNASDWKDFPDCRPEFIKSIGHAIEFAYGVKLLAPLLYASKADVVCEAKSLGVDLETTWTCYSPKHDEPCGVCYSCKAREAAGA